MKILLYFNLLLLFSCSNPNEGIKTEITEALTIFINSEKAIKSKVSLCISKKRFTVPRPGTNPRIIDSSQWSQTEFPKNINGIKLNLVTEKEIDLLSKQIGDVEYLDIRYSTYSPDTLLIKIFSSIRPSPKSLDRHLIYLGGVGYKFEFLKKYRKWVFNRIVEIDKS